MNSEKTSENNLNAEELVRYSRHLTLPEVGIKGQNKLKRASVLCVGSGGLGSPLMIYLAAAGVGRIGIIDFDVVEQSNLQRQVIHSTSWVGKKKTASARSRILEINPYCEVDLYDKALTNKNALDIIKKYDIVCDGTDNFPTRYLINDCCVLLGKPNVYGSVHRFEGQASVFNLEKSSPNYRDLLPKPPPPNIIPSCSEGGVLGVMPGIIGLVQATEVIKIITGVGKTLNGRLLVIDALSMTFKELKLFKSKNNETIKELIDYQEFCGIKSPQDHNNNFSTIESISVEELRDIISVKPQDIVILDVRTEQEAQVTAINNSQLIPLDRIETGEAIEEIRRLSLGKRLFVYCKVGIRSERALKILKTHSINGINIAGGVDAWNTQIIQI